VVAAAALLSAVAVAVGSGGVPAGSAPPRPYALGTYAGSADPAGVRAFSAQMGATVPYAMEFLDGTSWSTMSNPTWAIGRWSGSGQSMIWALPMLPDRGASLAVGASGAYDHYFASVAQDLVAGGQGHATVRVGWEFNGFWYPWYANHRAAQFVAYWRDIVTTMRSVPGAAFTFEWNPNVGDLGVGNLARYYPGDAYVDEVGMDVYDEASRTYPGAAAMVQRIETGPYGLDWLAAFARVHHRPMVFPEWGLGWGTSARGAPVAARGAVCGGDNPVFITQLSRWFTTHDVAEVSYWDYGSSRITGGRNPLAAAALRTSWAKSGPVRASTASPRG
jgi:hypothetical protein